MNSGKKNVVRKIVAILLAVLILGSVISGALIVMAGAASSKEIEKELLALREEQAEIKKQADALEESIAENQTQTQTLVEKKAAIDQQMEMSRQSIKNLNDQIQQYSLLIAQKQSELDASLQEEARMNEQYKKRLRSMEETGSISYWSILFKSGSFSDLLDNIDMIHEIAESDQLMLKKIAEMTAKIAAEREDLNQQMQQLEATKQELALQQEELEAQRTQSDELILQMAAEYAVMSSEYESFLSLEEEISKQIAQSETDYFNALSREEAERIAKLNAQNNNRVPASSSSGGSTGGFLFPLAYATCITDAYGWRVHPLQQTYKWHNGVDFAAGTGTEIYATKSGTVTSAYYNDAYGYMVTINHGDGFSSLYGHMTNYTVTNGEYVTQGQVIGYVGSTGWSTGPHMHFTIYYNGSDVNPMNYVSMP